MDKFYESLGESLFEIVPTVALCIDDNAIIVGANPYALEVLGFHQSNLINKPLSTIIKIDAKHEGSALIQHLLDANQSGFVKICLKDGRSFFSKVDIGERVICAQNVARRIVCLHDNGQFKVLLDEHLKYRNLLDTALAAIPDGFAIYDKDDRLQLYNYAYENYYQKSKELLKIGTKFEDIIRFGIESGQYPEAGTSEDSQKAWLKKRLDAHKNPQGPIVQKTNDRWLRIEERKLDDGRIAGIRADITQLMETKSVAESLGDILDNIAVPVFFTNLSTYQFEYANKACLEKFQYNLEEFTKLRPADLRVDPVGSQVDQFIKNVVKNQGDILTDRVQYIKSDGTTFPALISSMCETGDETSRIITLVQDETHKEQMQQVLDRQQAEREAILENVPAFITRSKPDTTMYYANDTYAENFNLVPDELIGKKFLDFVPCVHRAQVEKNIANFTPENPQHSFEQTMTDHKGEKLIVLWTNRMIYKDGEPFEIVGVGRDITPQKKAQAQIEQQARELALRNQALEQFAGIVSHDLRSPLRHIRMFGEILISEYHEGRLDNFEKYLSIISDKTEKMDRMVVSLLEFSQVAYKEVNLTHFDLSCAVKEASSILSNTIKSKQAEIELCNDMELTLDYDLFVRVLQNLLDNSLKYQKEGVVPHIYIDAAREHRQTKISISDNGIGIPEDQRERIFNVMQRLHRDENTYAGLGIGLSLVKRIVEGHNGEIVVDAKYKGGTKFNLTFPDSSFDK